MDKTITEKAKPYLAEIICTIITLALSIWLIGCEPTVPSLTAPVAAVTRAELQLEIEHLVDVAEQRMIALDKQDELRRMIFNNAQLIAQGGGVNPAGVVTTMMAIAGVGATVDGVRTRKKLKLLQSE